MSNTTLDVRVQIKNDIKSNWQTNDPILLKGEIGIEIDTRKFKIGDGVSAWNTLNYASAQSAILFDRTPTSTDDAYDIGILWINTASTPKKSYILLDNATNNAIWKQLITPDDLSDLGAGDMLKADFATNVKVSQGYVDKAIQADSLTSGETISLTGDVIATAVNFNGSEPITLATALQNIVTAGTYVKITVNSKGLVTGFEALADTDIPNLTLSKITDAGTAASKDVGSSAGSVVVVESNGKISPDIMPSIALTDLWVISSELEMLDLSADGGDIAVRTDINKTFILKESPATVLANWVELLAPPNAVFSVNGLTGTVTLTTTNIDEGTNLYYTEVRATSNFNTNFATKSSVGLTDGSSILHNTDTFILDGGTSSL